jgi:glycerate kinase
MVADAINRGCTTIIIGLGGSATCDGGRGMIEALKVSRCLANDCKIIAVCDVKNPLYGVNGAAHVFAPQKGATAKDVIILDKRLREFARETEAKGFATADMAFAEGAGAAGGLGYALLSYMKAELRPGIDFLLDIADFDNMINNANLVITGEGKSDAQTMMGKVPHGVLQHCKAKGIPVWLISGNIDDKEEILKNNFDLVSSINIGDNRPLDILMRKDIAVSNLQKTIGNLLGERLGNEASGKDKAKEIIYH